MYQTERQHIPGAQDQRRTGHRTHADHTGGEPALCDGRGTGRAGNRVHAHRCPA